MAAGDRIRTLFGIAHPIVLAPMAGVADFELAAEAAQAGALGSLPCAMLTPAQIRDQVGRIRARTKNPVNLNFFCHAPPVEDASRRAAWLDLLRPYYEQYGLDPDAPVTAANRAPFDDALCVVVEEIRPAVVSFHFGLPAPALLHRVKAAGCRVISSATTVAEAQWLEANGVDAVIVQGYEAGGHRGMFLNTDTTRQAGTFALLPQIVDAVRVPVIASGGIADARGIVAAFALGASGVQIGTAYLFCPEAKISAAHRAALAQANDESTAITNVITGRPARGFVTRVVGELGPMNDGAPAFPTAAVPLAALRAAAEGRGLGDFSTMWAGQAAGLGRALGAGELTRTLMTEAGERLRDLGGGL